MRNVSFFILLYVCFAFGQSYELVWSDEFDGDKLDTSKWEVMLGDGQSYGLPSGWGNNELQFYRRENIEVKNGYLIITAKKESYGGKSYTSGRIRTKGKGDWLYGRFEMRAKMPIGRGLWPAFWMLPSSTKYGGWAASGEIDIMEYIGHEPNTVHGTLHYGGTWPQNVHKGSSYTLPSGTFADDFHTFALEWEPKRMSWFVDGRVFRRTSEWYSTNGPYPAPFDVPFHILINLAVGGNWPGAPDASTQFPQQLVIDYVRVYQIPSAVEKADQEEPEAFEVYPNPCNQQTVIRIELEHPQELNLAVFDIHGRCIDKLFSGVLVPGIHQWIWGADHNPSGLYFVRMESLKNRIFRRIVLLK